MVSLILGWLWDPLFWIGMVLTVWCIYFYRDPERVTPMDDDLVISPADGKVSFVGLAVPPAELDLGYEPMTRVSVFMNVFSVHINRSPVRGKIDKVVHRPGKFLNAELDKASTENERNSVLIESPHGKVGVVQIAGLVARRIVCWSNQDDELSVGERFGLIRFGSRVDVYLPSDATVRVAVGQTAIAGETVLADYGTERANPWYGSHKPMETPFPPFEPNGRVDASRGPKLSQIPLRIVVPNVITVLAICAGLTGIRLAFENRFELAVAMVLLAAFLDGIDGRIARMIKGSSKFGAQMDSLADIVNFGVAPALVLYAFMLDQARSFGWIAALLYAIACCLRLARFNVMLEDPNRPAWQNNYFIGVPAPAGAMLVLLPVYLGFLGLMPTRALAFGVAAYTVAIAFLLVSRLPVYNGKSAGSLVRRDIVMPLILCVVIYVALLMSFTWQTLSLTALAYLAFLPFSLAAWNKREAADRKKAAEEASSGDN